jgi:hypothetical protein
MIFKNVFNKTKTFLKDEIIYLIESYKAIKAARVLLIIIK